MIDTIPWAGIPDRLKMERGSQDSHCHCSSSASLSTPDQAVPGTAPSQLWWATSLSAWDQAVPGTAPSQLSLWAVSQGESFLLKTVFCQELGHGDNRSNQYNRSDRRPTLNFDSEPSQIPSTRQLACWSSWGKDWKKMRNLFIGTRAS